MSVAPAFPEPEFQPSPAELHRQFQQAAAFANRNTYRLLVLIRQMDACAGHEAYGCKTLAHYLELVCGITRIAARERIRVASRWSICLSLRGHLGPARLSIQRSEPWRGSRRRGRMRNSSPPPVRTPPGVETMAGAALRMKRIAEAVHRGQSPARMVVGRRTKWKSSTGRWIDPGTGWRQDLDARGLSVSRG